VQDPDFERGLDRARDLLFEIAAALQLTSNARLNPNLRVIGQELQSKNILVLATDKNLGIAAVGKTWYISECTKQLSDRTYQRITEERVIKCVAEVEYRINLLFLTVPVFKGLPKVHKPTWSLSP